MTTFGCPYRCDFCSKPVSEASTERRNLDRIFREVDQLQGLGYDTLWIADDSFTLSIPHVQEFCRRMEGRGMGWSRLSRVTGMDTATARMMKEAGCRRVYLGIESGSQQTLRMMNKRATVEDAVSAVHLYRDAGRGGGLFQGGLPGRDGRFRGEDFRPFPFSSP